MKIKLSNEESRKKIEQLNSRLKLLTSDIHTESKPFNMNSPFYASEAQGQFFRETNNKFFKSATNLNSHNLFTSNSKN